jgi:hypothetical protein
MHFCARWLAVGAAAGCTAAFLGGAVTISLRSASLPAISVNAVPFAVEKSFD